MITIAYTIRKSIVGSSVAIARWRMDGIDYNTSEEFFDDKDYKSITRDHLRRLVKRTTEYIEDESFKMGKSFSVTHLMPDRLVKLMIE